VPSLRPPKRSRRSARRQGFAAPWWPTMVDRGEAKVSRKLEINRLGYRARSPKAAS